MLWANGSFFRFSCAFLQISSNVSIFARYMHTVFIK